MADRTWVDDAAAAFIADLELIDSSLAARGGFAQPIINAATERTETDTAALLQGLSQLLAAPGMVEHVSKHFGPLLVDLMARWIGQREVGLLEEERRLAVVAALCGTLPELWT
jgi:hypothetical protein